MDPRRGNVIGTAVILAYLTETSLGTPSYGSRSTHSCLPGRVRTVTQRTAVLRVLKDSHADGSGSSGAEASSEISRAECYKRIAEAREQMNDLVRKLTEEQILTLKPDLVSILRKYSACLLACNLADRPPFLRGDI